jgi:serine/threonine-protein kinase
MKYCPACHKTYPGDYNVCPADQTGLQSSHELQPGMIIRNKYEIIERIGIGGMGAVYRGRHITFNEFCAIKIVNDSIAGDANFLQRFQTEAVVTRKLRHPNAVRVDDFDYTEDGRPFIVMELVEGRNIGDILQAEGPFRVARAIRIAVQVARALGVAHKLGVVHRDIKPANILLTTNEQGNEIAKVLDFGIAKLREAAGDTQPGMTMTGMVVGTPLYMSPEQFMGKKGGEIDGRTDLYSLGVVLYQMVTAQLPFEGETIYSLMMQHLEGTVRPPHEAAPDRQIPDSLSQVILKSIDKAREKRFQTADEFVAALEQVETEPVSSIPVATGAVASEPVANVASTPSTPVSQVATVATLEPSQPVPAPTVPKPEPSQAVQVPTPQPSVAIPAPPPVEPQPAVVSVKTALPPDSVLVKSAAQHVFLQPRRFRLKHLLVLVILCLAGALVGWVGYVKYQVIRREGIENEVRGTLKNASSATVHLAGVTASVTDSREVILEGNVPSREDSDKATLFAGSVHGVTDVHNHIRVTAPVVPPTAPAASADSLINDGSAHMDKGEYDEAIKSFTDAGAADPQNKKAQEWLDRAQRAKAMEEKLLKNRQ